MLALASGNRRRACYRGGSRPGARRAPKRRFRARCLSPAPWPDARARLGSAPFASLPDGWAGALAQRPEGLIARDGRDEVVEVPFALRRRWLLDLEDVEVVH